MAGPATKKQKVALTQFEKLASLSTIVADTGEIAQIKKYSPTDATTNPSLLFKASSASEHQGLVEDALAYGKALKGGLLCARALSHLYAHGIRRVPAVFGHPKSTRMQ